MLTHQEILEKATEFVEKWRQYHNRPENPFGSPERGPFQKLISDLEHNKVLVSTKVIGTYVLRDHVHGSPFLLDNGNEIVFGNISFAEAVMLELKRQKLYEGIDILQKVK